MSQRGESSKAYFEKLAKWSKSDIPSKHKIVRVFMNVHMGYGHKGLSGLAKEFDLDVDNLDRGEFVVFINTKQTAMKVYAAGNCLAHLKMPGSAQIDMGVIRLLPSFFAGRQINYKGALSQLIRSRGIETNV